MNGEEYGVNGVRFAVHGEGPYEPAPQGSKKIVGKKGQKGRLKESSPYHGPWRDKVIDASAKVLTEQCEGVVFEGPLHVDLTFHMPRGKTVKRVHHTTYPDADKLTRCVFDGLTQGGLIKDDAIIVSGSFEKRYATPESGQGVLITIHRVLG